MRNEFPLTVPISKVIDEAEGIKSIILPLKLGAKPGQFAMIWLPGVDAKPCGISYQDEKSFGITVSAVGEWSNKVCNLKQGDLLGVMGPYGTHFNLEGKKIILVGGGYGAASLMLLAEQAVKQGIDTAIVIGARSSSYLIYRERVKKLGLKAIFTTDDGSYGEKGYNTAVLERLLKQENIDKVFACGPELMEKKVAEICIENKIKCELSIERYMKCGFGICGACCVDNSGKRVCVEGTVFTAEEALSMQEFGKYHRDASATKHGFGK